MKTTKTYKGFKLITHKMRKGGYETFIFNGGVKAINRIYSELKRNSIGVAENMIDNGDEYVR